MNERYKCKRAGKTFVKVNLPCTRRHKSLQQEGEEVGESVELTIETYVLVSQFDTEFNVGKLLFFQ